MFQITESHNNFNIIFHHISTKKGSYTRYLGSYADQAIVDRILLILPDIADKGYSLREVQTTTNDRRLLWKQLNQQKIQPKKKKNM